MRRTVSTYITFLLVGAFLASCAGKTVRRDPRSSYSQNKSRAKSFSGIRKKVALLDFFNESPYGGADLAVVASNELRRELSRTGEFIFDNAAKKTFGSSKEIYAGGGIKLVQVARRAKINGINFVIFGRIEEARVREKTDEVGIVRKTNSYTNSKIEIRIFDVNANKEIYTETVRGDADNKDYRLFNSTREDKLTFRRDLLRYGVKVAIRRSIPKIIKLSSRMDWMGRVARIIDNKIYINAGRTSGIQVGDILKVITEGQEIYDPETGALLGKSKGEVKGTIEVIDYFGPDGAICILHSGGTVQEGDFVQLY
ncbi:MAG: hypothetical protein KAG61_02720 [Bacteriovoracaceae bacterium]|nr:hypothetical protein [Bacteriovoracaceae bacterium]